jgi:hypothetical protein
VLVGFSMGGGEVAGAKHVSHTAAKRQQGRTGRVGRALHAQNRMTPRHAKETFDEMTAGMKVTAPSFFAGFFQGLLWCQPAVASGQRGVDRQLLQRVDDAARSEATACRLHHRRRPDFLPQSADADHSWHHDKTVPIDAAGRAAAKGIANSTLLSTKVHRMVCLHTHKDRWTSFVTKLTSAVVTYISQLR